ncbi:MAG: hypothetical protein WAM70_20975 [Pyrinomonadaceae bacterium]
MKLRTITLFVVAGAAILAPSLAQVARNSSAAEPAPVAAAKRVHHYVYFGMDRTELKNAKSFLETKQFEGAQVAYSWRQLEQGKDNYDFGLINEDLAFLNSHGKKLWIQFSDVTFSPERINVPQYLMKDPKYNGGADKQYKSNDDKDENPEHEGWMGRRWDPAVQERLHKLFVALGKEFDGRIAGINLAESSVGVGRTGKLWPKGFTREVYRDAVIANMKELKRAFPKSIAMVYANFMPGGRPYLEAVYKAARESNVAVGGPDLMPFRPFQRSNSYPLIRESAGKVPTGLAVQDGNYSDVNKETGKRADIAELLKYGSEELKLDYIFWCTEEPHYSQELIPFMRSTKLS